MSNVVAFNLDTAGGMDRLTDLLTSPDSYVACLGRAFASPIGTALQDWLQAETERGTDRVLLLEVVCNLSVQHVASVAAHALKPTGDDAAKALLAGIVETRLPTYIASIRAMKGGAK